MVSRSNVMQRIRAYQFALYDLALFQDSHPDDMAAMKLRTIYQEKLKKLMDEYEQSYGQLVLTHDQVDENWHQWIDDPWPWDLPKGDA